eukprot:11246073-Ditylum_brightwellii.AAC.1
MEPYLMKKNGAGKQGSIAALICDVIPEGEGKQHTVPVDRKENALQTKVDKARERVSRLVALRKRMCHLLHLTAF